MATAKKKSYTVVKKPDSFLAKTPKASRVTLAKDKDGYFLYTHRVRSASHKSINAISKKTIESIEASG